jgi:hypothetical protein
LVAETSVVRVTEGTGRRKRDEWMRRTAILEGREPPPPPRHEDGCSERSGGRQQIHELARVLRIRESPNRRPMAADEDGSAHSWGSDLRIILEGRSTATIHVYHEGRLIDWVEWAWGAQVQDALGLLGWVDRMGIPQPLRELEEKQARLARQVRAHAVWQASAPACIRPMLPASGIADVLSSAPWRALRGAYATEADAFVALLRWLGSTEVVEYMDYDRVIIELLVPVSPSKTLAVVEQLALDPVELEGVCRLVAYWAIGRNPGAATAIVAPAMRRRLLDHARTSPLCTNREAIVAALS